jgi:hypothetical protein
MFINKSLTNEALGGSTVEERGKFGRFQSSVK